MSCCQAGSFWPWTGLCALLTPPECDTGLMSGARNKRLMRGACSRGKSETMVRCDQIRGNTAIMRSLRTSLRKQCPAFCSKGHFKICFWENCNLFKPLQRKHSYVKSTLWTSFKKRLHEQFIIYSSFSFCSFFLPLESWCRAVWLLCNCLLIGLAPQLLASDWLLSPLRAEVTSSSSPGTSLSQERASLYKGC